LLAEVVYITLTEQQNQYTAILTFYVSTQQIVAVL